MLSHIGLAALCQAALIVVPLFACVALLPMPRAWILALCGNYEAAIRIYEKKLARYPSQLHLYLRLAPLYLLAGRRDANALIAYRIFLQIHFAVGNFKAAGSTRVENFGAAKI